MKYNNNNRNERKSEENSHCLTKLVVDGSNDGNF